MIDRRLTTTLLSLLLLCGCASVPPSPYGKTEKVMPSDDKGTLTERLHRAHIKAQQEPENITAQHHYLYYQRTFLEQQTAHIQQAIHQKQFDEAEIQLKQLLAEEPHAPEAGTLRNMITQAMLDDRLVTDAQTQFQAGQYAKSYANISTVLNHNPDNIDALTLQAKLMQHQLEMHKPVDQEQDKLLAASISLSYKNATLSQVFNSFAQISHLNFYFDPAVPLDDTITFFIQKSTVRQALHNIVHSVGLQAQLLGGKGVFIYPNTKQTTYDPLMIRAFPITHTDPKSIAGSLRTLLDLKEVIVDANQQTIIIKDTLEKLKAAEQIILLQDQPAPEVELEMSIIELSKIQALNLGFNWPTTIALTPLSMNPGAAGQTANTTTLHDLKHLNSQRIAAQIGSIALNTNEHNEAAQILANPRIRVKNHQKAKIQIGNRFPIISSTSTSTGLVSDNVSFVDVGLKLEVTPDISEDNEVTLNVNLEVSNIINQLQTKDGNPIYVIGTRNAATILRLKNEETQILGGLISNNIKRSGGGLPGASRIPLLGYLFGARANENNESEVILSITPHIIRSGYNFNASLTPIIVQPAAQPSSHAIPAYRAPTAINTDSMAGAPAPRKTDTPALRQRLYHKAEATEADSAAPHHHSITASGQPDNTHKTPPASLFGR